MRISDWSSDVCSSDLGGGARCTTRHRLEPGLFAAIEAGQRMHKGLVHQQLVAVVFAEAGVGAQADAGRAGRGLGDQVGVEFNADLMTNEKGRSEEHTSELQSLMRLSYAVFCLQNIITITYDYNSVPL